MYISYLLKDLPCLNKVTLRVTLSSVRVFAGEGGRGGGGAGGCLSRKEQALT